MSYTEFPQMETGQNYDFLGCPKAFYKQAVEVMNKG